MLLHATTIMINQKAVVITGAAGCGKSDLALRLIDGGGTLIADDQTQLSVIDGQLLAASPPSIVGLLEIRHVGIYKVPYITDIPVHLCVDAATGVRVDRLPPADTVEWLGCKVPRIRLDLLLPSTPAKIRAIMTYPVAHV